MAFSRRHGHLTDTMNAKSMSVISFIKEEMKPRLEQWEKDVWSFQADRKTMEQDKQRRRLLDMLSQMSSHVRAFQKTFGYKPCKVNGDFLKALDECMSDDMDKKIQKWQKYVNQILSGETAYNATPDLEDRLNMILSQIQNWEQKLLPRETERQQKTTPQMVVGDQRDKEQQPIVASTTAEAKHDSLAKRIEELQREVSKLQMRYDSKVAEILENNKTVQQQRAIINGLEKETKEQHAMINTITREKQELLNRLSEVAGHKLRENNAAITDLSSAIRPTKIAELYKELYDNQWTDAFEELKDQGYPEITAIQILNNTVYDSFEFTSDLSRQYMEHLEFSTKILPYQKEGSQKAGGQNHQSHMAKTVPVRNLQHPAGNRITVEKKPIPTKVLSEECKDLLRQLRKTSAPAHVEEVQMCFIEGKKRKVPPNNQKAMNAFYKECAKVTWYMNVQTPPLSLTSSPARGTPFLTDLYTPYTQSGNMVDYVVWPACLLHENGPLLRKGVLQPFKSEEGVGVEKEKSKNALDGGQPR